MDVEISIRWICLIVKMLQEQAMSTSQIGKELKARDRDMVFGLLGRMERYKVIKKVDTKWELIGIEQIALLRDTSESEELLRTGRI